MSFKHKTEGEATQFVPTHPLAVEDYVRWIQDPRHGCRKELVADELTFVAQFKPYEYIACLELHSQDLDDSMVRQIVNELNGMQYFDFSIRLDNSLGELLKHDLLSDEQFQDRVKYYSFDMQEDVKLLEGADTLSCALYHFERTYGASPVSTFLLGFPLRNKDEVDVRSLLVYDRIFNQKWIKFDFSKEDLKNLPKLKTI